MHFFEIPFIAFVFNFPLFPLPLGLLTARRALFPLFLNRLDERPHRLLVTFETVGLLHSRPRRCLGKVTPGGFGGNFRPLPAVIRTETGLIEAAAVNVRAHLALSRERWKRRGREDARKVAPGPVAKVREPRD